MFVCGVPDVPFHVVREIDLGVRRSIATVLLSADRPLRRGDLIIRRDGAKNHRLGMLNRRVAELQQARKWEQLRRIKSKRRHVSEHHDRLDAIRIAKTRLHEGSMMAVGHPKSIKYQNYRGNGKRKRRQLLQRQFTYCRRIPYMFEECVERGVTVRIAFEAWTSKRCHRCNSMNTRRMSQSLLWRLDYGLQYNADWNAAINIGSAFFARGAESTDQSRLGPHWG